MGLSRQEYWSGLLRPLPGELPNSGIEPISPASPALTRKLPLSHLVNRNNLHAAVLCLVTQLCPVLCYPMGCSLPGSSVHGDSSGQNSRMGCHALLQRIFPTQGSNTGLPTLQVVSLLTEPQGKPIYVQYILPYLKKDKS